MTRRADAVASSLPSTPMILRLQWFSCSLAALMLASCASGPRLETTAVRRGLESSPEARRVKLGRALTAADLALQQGLQHEDARQRYNKAVMEAVESWMALADQPSRQTITQSEDGGNRYSLQATWPSTLLFDELIPASRIPSRELKERLVRDGVGTPLVAWWRHTNERAKTEPFMAAAGYLAPATATLTFSPAPGGRRTASLVLHDPRKVDNVRLAGLSQPLAEDISAVGEFLLSRREVRMSGLGALLQSGKHLDKLGLIALERPTSDRVPVIMVHGLMSKPATWQNVVNELWGDPLLQRTCQFLFFRYPTGVPVIYSAAKLREKLGLLHRELERTGHRATSDHMVLIGHSMGGLVSKSQVQESGDRLWVNVFGSTPDKLKLSPKEIEAMRAYLEYRPNPYISRVIFVATPHRGSSLAAGAMGAVGGSLVNLPKRIVGDAFNVLQGQLPEQGPLREMLDKGVPTSIDNLSPKSKFVQTSISLPLRPGLHVHSIIGNKKQKPLNDPACSDGFVPYTSAHLDGVESELVVPFGHSAHEHPQAVEEIRRILHLHVRSL